ncbi:MAG: DUF5694 domain-containing protein [Bacteroidota bacterium]
MRSSLSPQQAFLLFFALAYLGSCTNEPRVMAPTDQVAVEESPLRTDEGQIAVLNLGTFHMGYTSDANTVEYDEAAEENARQIALVCEQLARFEPTVICVEEVTSDQVDLAAAYALYRDNPKHESVYAESEIQILAFEVGRLVGTKKVFAIDHKLAYNYDQSELAEATGSQAYFGELEYLQGQFGLFEMDSSLSQSLLRMNTPHAYDVLINVNADVLAHANSSDGFEGADEAAKYYQRNLRIFANLNKLPLSSEDRVLIISGASHAAFLDMLMRRSQKYQAVDLKKYLH